jgi:hypothetical protein
MSLFATTSIPALRPSKPLLELVSGAISGIQETQCEPDQLPSSNPLLHTSSWCGTQRETLKMKRKGGVDGRRRRLEEKYEKREERKTTKEQN